VKLGEPIDAAIPWVRAIDHFDEARALRSAGHKLERLRHAAERAGDELREDPKVASVRTLPISDLIYPSKYAFNGALRLPLPYVTMRHRCLLVQLEVEGEIKNLLFNPTDRQSSRETPFFKELLDRFGWAEALIGKTFGSAEDGLRALGLAPEDIDLIAFDHFHTQDLRPTLGTTRGDGIAEPLAARFPNARLLAPRTEWEDWDHLHPMQRAWFIRDGKKNVRTDRVVLTDRDLWLGKGCLLIRTPGHTSGNQTLFVHADGGVFGCSENGTSADNWSPYESRLPGLRSHARRYDLEVVINSNTPELGAEQYASMVLERTIVDRVPDAPAFVQMFPSSEVTPSPVAPGVRPSVVFGERTSGTVRTAKKRARGVSAHTN
jgi:hypothetical protein